jgi:hypothetical protein
LYDSEPDYLSNALYILQSGYPISSHHPGTISYYLISFLLFLIKPLSLDLSSTIYLIRLSLCFIGSIIIFNCKNIKSLEIVAVFILIALLEGFYITLSVVSAELLILPLSFLLLDQLKNNKNSISIIGVTYGLMLNIKFSAILLIPYLIANIIFTFKNEKGIKLIKIGMISSGIFILLSLPVIGNLHLVILRSLTQALQLIDLILNNSIYLNLFFIILLFVSVAAFFLIINYLKIIEFKSFFTKKNTYKALNILFGTAIIILIFINPKEIRHFVPFLPFIVCMHLFNDIKITSAIFLTRVFLIIYFLIWTLYRYPDFEISRSVDELIEKQTGKVFFIQTANFSSEMRFIEWMNYAYGKNSINVPENWINKFSKLSTGNAELLNTRNFLNSYEYLENGNLFKDSYLHFYKKDFNYQIDILLDKKGVLLLSPKDYDLYNNFLENLNLNSDEKLILVPNKRPKKTATFTLKKKISAGSN